MAFEFWRKCSVVYDMPMTDRLSTSFRSLGKERRSLFVCSGYAVLAMVIWWLMRLGRFRRSHFRGGDTANLSFLLAQQPHLEFGLGLRQTSHPRIVPIMSETIDIALMTSRNRRRRSSCFCHRYDCLALKWLESYELS